MSADKRQIKVNIKVVPALNAHITFTLVNETEREEKPIYKEPQTTDEAKVEILYTGNGEYKAPQTTDGL